MVEEFTDENLLKHQAVLRRFASKLTKMNSLSIEDVVQQTNLRALEKRHTFKPGNFRGWLMALMYSQFSNMIRHSNRRIKNDPQSTLARKEDDDVQYSSQTAEISLLLRDMKKAFEKLSDKQKECVRLVRQDGMDYDTCAKVLNVPEGTVRSRLHRAHATWRAAYDN